MNFCHFVQIEWGDFVFYDNYVRLCNSVNKTPSAVALEIGIAKPTVSRWKSGSNPNRATLLKVADYFHVPVDELTGTAASPAAVSGFALSDVERQLVLDFRSLDSSGRELVLQVVANAVLAHSGKNKAVSDMETAQ